MSHQVFSIECCLNTGRRRQRDRVERVHLARDDLRQLAAQGSAGQGWTDRHPGRRVTQLEHLHQEEKSALEI